MNTTTNTRVSEAMVDAMTEAWFAGYAMHRDSPIPEDAWSYGASRAEAEAFARKYIAALSAPEPAAQGDAVATVKSWTNGSYHRNYVIEWHRNVNAGTKLYTAPPAQPAERVPEGYALVPAEAGDTDAFMVLHEYQQPGRTRKDAYRIAIRKLSERASEMLDASPAPSEGGKGVDRDAARFRFVVEHNWIGAKTRCSEGIQDSDLASARLAVDRAMNTTGAAR